MRFSSLSFALIVLLGFSWGCSPIEPHISEDAAQKLIDLLEYNDITVKELEQAQLDEFCGQAQQAGLDYLEQHQSNYCAAAALIAEQEKGLSCDEEYEKCMAIDIQTEFIDLCTAAGKGCACDWDKTKDTAVFNCFDTVTEFDTCLSDIFSTVNLTHAALSVTCGDKDSATAFYEMSQETVPDCVADVFPSCFLVLDFNWSFSTAEIYNVLYN